jgi:hypothetical protein
MSDRDKWKMLHLLNVFGQPHLTHAELQAMGIHCYMDTIQELVDEGAVTRSRRSGIERYELDPGARSLVNNCLVGSPRWQAGNVFVDLPEVFVIMPFSEPWSPAVEEQLIKPAVGAAQLTYVRGDLPVRIGDLAQNVWDAILHAGVVVADISVANPNVYYEIGLVHGLGKDTLYLKQAGIPLPADFGNAHYYEYDLGDLSAGRLLLTNALEKWTDLPGVKALAVGTQAAIARGAPSAK